MRADSRVTLSTKETKMKLKTLRFEKGKGWGSELTSELDSSNTLVLAFASPSFRDNLDPLLELGKQLPNSIIVGCSTSGEIFDSELSDNSISVAIAQFERTQLRISTQTVETSSDSLSAGEKIATELQSAELASILVVSNGLTVNGSALTAGLNNILPKSVAVTGGLAGDGDRFEDTWVLLRKQGKK